MSHEHFQSSIQYRPLSPHPRNAIEQLYAGGPMANYCVVGVMFNMKDVRQVYLEWL